MIPCNALIYKNFFGKDIEFSSDSTFDDKEFPLIGAYLSLGEQIVKTKLELLPEDEVEKRADNIRIRTGKELRQNFIDSFGYEPIDVFNEMVKDVNHEIFKI